MLSHAVAEDYPQIEVEDWYVDIMAANLVDPATRSRFQVFLLPNLYGDILTDEAALERRAAPISVRAMRCSMPYTARRRA